MTRHRNSKPTASSRIIKRNDNVVHVDFGTPKKTPKKENGWVTIDPSNLEGMSDEDASSILQDLIRTSHPSKLKNLQSLIDTLDTGQAKSFKPKTEDEDDDGS